MSEVIHHQLEARDTVFEHPKLAAIIPTERGMGWDAGRDGDMPREDKDLFGCRRILPTPSNEAAVAASLGRQQQ